MDGVGWGEVFQLDGFEVGHDGGEVVRFAFEGEVSGDPLGKMRWVCGLIALERPMTDGGGEIVRFWETPAGGC